MAELTPKKPAPADVVELDGEDSDEYDDIEVRLVRWRCGGC